MHAMQYQFAFPSGFDLQLVRDRVADIGHRFDSLPGLHYKAFLVSERRGDEPACYAPLYVWRNRSGMHAFILSDAFAAVCEKYGRPVVQEWMPLHFIKNKGKGPMPLSATREFRALPADQNLATLASNETEWARVTAAHGGVHSVFVGVDVHSWTLARFVLWHREPDTEHPLELLYLAQAARGYHARGA